MYKHGTMISLIGTLVLQIKHIFCGDEKAGKEELCTILLKHLYLQKSLDCIDIREIVGIINRNNNCDLEKIYRHNNLSSELYCFLYTHGNTFSNDEMKVLNNVISQREYEINNLFTKQIDSVIKQYINKNIYWFWGFLFLTYGSAWVSLLAKGIDCSYSLIALLTIIYVAIAASLVLVPDCLVWIADRSNILERGCLVLFLERKYNQYSWIKSFFDYHTKE